MIRPCTVSDIPFVMKLGKRFADDAGVTEQVGWNDDSVRDLLNVLIADHILLRGDQSILGGMVFKHPFSGELVFQELFWRSEAGREGLKLLDAAERIAAAMGARLMMMLGVDTMPGSRKIYERRGYRPAEFSYTKRI